MAEAAVGRGESPSPGAADPSPAGEPPPPDGAFTELRTLLIGPEQQTIRALHAHLNDGAARTREVSRVLPEALALRGNDPELARVLGPTIEDAITSSVHRDPRPLADALFPVMGPAIRKAIEHMLESMMESFNRTVEQSVSWRALQWRWTAWRTGKPFAEVVLLNTLQYRVEQVFLIHAETGLLLQHASAARGESQDADQVSAMLTAIRDFVRDSFKVGSADSLEAFRVGDLTIVVEQGPYAVLAGVVRGAAPPDLRGIFSRALESIHLLLGAELKDFKGDSAAFTKARPALETCLVTQLRTPRRRPAYGPWVAATALVVVGVGVWGFLAIRERQRWQSYLARLGNEPGLVVLSSARRGGMFVVSGLRDPLARDPRDLLAGTGITPSKVEAHWEPYEGQQPAFVAARATALLRPPSGVVLSYGDGRLEARGDAPDRWLIDAERLAPAVAGVRRFEYAGPSVAERIASRLADVPILFGKGQSGLEPDQVEHVTQAASLLSQLADALRVRGQSATLEVLGHTDSDGSDWENGPLSEARAETVRRMLAATALDEIALSARGVGSTDPRATGTEEADKVLNRRVSLRVTMGPGPKESRP